MTQRGRRVRSHSDRPANDSKGEWIMGGKGGKRNHRTGPGDVAVAARRRHHGAPTDLDERAVAALAAELAEATGIAPAVARNILERLEVAPLVDTINAARRLMSDPVNLERLGFSSGAAAQACEDSRYFQLNLANIRLSTRIAPRLEAAPQDQRGIDVCMVSLLVRKTDAPGVWSFGHDTAAIRHKVPRRSAVKPRRPQG